MAGLLAGLPWAYYPLVRPWLLRWGATDDEVRRALPGDETVHEPAMVTTRAITIDASPDAVWSRVAQIGQGRGGFYSYDWLENVAGCDIHSAERIVPELQQPQVGTRSISRPVWGWRWRRLSRGGRSGSVGT
jgi:hypothetical protein